MEDAAADGTLWLSVLRDGHPLDLVVAPNPGEWHGISLDRGGLGDDPRTCRNACRFCFVDQVPAGLRAALSVKDDDYRLSFLHGNFMTLTNLSEPDIERIEELRLSPLYVSLHAWDDAARVRLMGRAAAGSRGVLERLAAAGLDLHLQVVLCPGWNDGDVLAETVLRAGALDAVVDLGVVPVSLAAEGDLSRVTPEDARRVIGAVETWQSEFSGGAGAPSCTPPTSSTCWPAPSLRPATRPSSTRTASASPPPRSPRPPSSRLRGRRARTRMTAPRRHRLAPSPACACSAARSRRRCSARVGAPSWSRPPASPCGASPWRTPSSAHTSP